MKTDKNDVLWNYAATFLKIASQALLLPLILTMMSAEKVGIYVVFITINSFALLLDFGFNSSFTRNVTYVFSGVKSLKKQGYEKNIHDKSYIDYNLLKGLISVMKRFYLVLSIVLFFLLITIGSSYIYFIVKDYQGDLIEVFIAWIILVIINTYNIYTLYYGALLLGKGLVKKSKQITIIGQIVFLCFSAILIILGYGLIAIFTAQGLSVIIIRFLSKKTFFTKQILKDLNLASKSSNKEIFDSIYPNSLKIGITSLGAFMVHRSTIIIGSLYLTLENIASFGITLQIIGVLTGLAGIYTNTYLPKINELRVRDNLIEIKKIYLKGQLSILIIFLLGSVGLLVFGDWTLNLLQSSTKLIPSSFITCMLIFALLETNHSVAGHILLTKNEVPFFKASIISGIGVVIILLIFLNYTELGLLSLILAPGIAQAVYQNWKWPMEVNKDLKITIKDFFVKRNYFAD